MRKYNLKYRKPGVTTYTWTGLKNPFSPSLIMSSAVRKILKIRRRQGRILNAEESLIYRLSEVSEVVYVRLCQN